MSDISREVLAERVEQRRTFAIISHPDAGKTTLTEKLLLFAGAIQIAGSVKARKASRHATSDWMEIEKQRGISVASSVMQMEYRDYVINLLDTPGHQDFSEDTYRVLTAVDAALMVIDAANGVEAQTLRLLEVCRARGTPIITFINKMDREVREPLDLIDEIERVLGMAAVPFTWPIGMGKSFHGVLRPARGPHARVPARRGPAGGRATRSSSGLDHPSLRERFGAEFEQARHDIELVRAATPVFSREEFLAGRQTPVFFGSAINNFGVRRCSTRWSTSRRRRARASRCRARSQPDDERFSGVVFKIQANMDPAHRDRIAFVRVCSGHFERGMRLKRAAHRQGAPPQHRGVLPVAAPRAARRGLRRRHHRHPHPRRLQLGDTLTEGEALQFTGLPFFAPEIFRTIEVRRIRCAPSSCAPGCCSSARKARSRCSARCAAPMLLLGAVGQLQFEVVAHRLEHEYGVEARLMPGVLHLRALGVGRRSGGARQVRGSQCRPGRTRCRRCAGGTDRYQVRDESDPGSLARHQIPYPARARRADSRSDCRYCLRPNALHPTQRHREHREMRKRTRTK